MPTNLFLLGHMHGATMVACGLGVLASDTKSPEVAQPSVGPNLLHLLQVFMKFVVQTIGQDLAVFSILHILLSVEEPVWDHVLVWILHSGGHTFYVFLSELSCPLGEVDVCFPQHHMSKSLPHTLNCCNG